MSPLQQEPPQYTRNVSQLTTSQDDVPASLLDQALLQWFKSVSHGLCH